MKKLLVAIGWIAAFVAGCAIGRCSAEQAPCTAGETRVTTVDTSHYRNPTPTSEVATDTRRYTLPMLCFVPISGKREQSQAHTGEVDTTACSHSADSAVAELPIVQRHYADSAYQAWVSGPVDPQLDSIRVFAPTTVITITEKATPKRWHIGPAVGFGYTPRGVQPYAGVSLTYSMISW